MNQITATSMMPTYFFRCLIKTMWSTVSKAEMSSRRIKMEGCQCLSFSWLVSPPLWSRLKYLSIYYKHLLDCNRILYVHSWALKDEFMTGDLLTCSPDQRFKFVVIHLLDGLVKVRERFLFWSNSEKVITDLKQWTQCFYFINIQPKPQYFPSLK